MRRAKKVVLIGIDAMTLDFVYRYCNEGVLPNISKLVQNGTTSEAFPALPAGTAQNWNTIVTGAYVGTHGVTAMHIHEPGDSLSKKHEAFFSTDRQAESLWEAAEKAGKKSILLKYTTSWPPTIKKGIHVEGHSCPWTNPFQIHRRHCFATEDVGFGDKIVLTKFRGEHIGKTHQPPLTSFLIFRKGNLEKKKFPMLVVDENGKGYDTILVYDDIDFSNCITRLKEGKWSNWITTKFSTEKALVEGIFRFRPLKISPDARIVRIYSSQVFASTGWTYPDSLAKELVEKFGPFQEYTCLWLAYENWTDEEIISDELKYQAEWLGNAAEYLLKSNDWDIFFTQWHGIDYVGHWVLGGMDPKSIYYLPEREEMCKRMFQLSYQIADEYVGRIMEQCDDETMIVLTSDHGILPVRTNLLNVNDLLEKKGLLHYKPQADPLRERVIDWGKSKAGQIQGSYVYVNLKGREPDGMVEPRDYEKIRDEIIRTIQEATDPTSGDYIAEFALRKEDAEFLGIYGPRAGDVVFFIKAEYSRPCPKVSPKKSFGIAASGDFGFGQTGDHHPFLHTAKFDLGTMRAMTIFTGPSIKRNLRRENSINLVDIAPTISALTDIPLPEKSEGKILYDIFQK